jgi:ribosome-associated protein
MLQVGPGLTIDDADLEEQFVRSSGPGGQNVNKVSTAVQLRFNVAGAKFLSEAWRQQLIEIAGKRMTSDGWLVIEARRFRTQAENREDARERLLELIRLASVQPATRHKTRPTKASKERRLTSKRRRADMKSRRRDVTDDDH